VAGLIEDYAIIGDMQYDPRYARQVGNTPQAFSHVPLIQTALNLDQHAGAHCRRSARNEPAVSGFSEP
jgi:hypothetical protein